MQHRRTGALLGVACLLMLAACGSGSDSAARPVADEPPVATPVADEPPVATEAAPDDDASEPGVTVPAPVAEKASDVPPVTAAPEAPAPVEPEVGGRLFAADVEPAARFATNPFPDLVVDDIGKDASVNIKNILPSDRPVLLWAWAPH